MKKTDQKIRFLIAKRKWKKALRNPGYKMKVPQIINYVWNEEEKKVDTYVMGEKWS